MKNGRSHPRRNTNASKIVDSRSGCAKRWAHCLGERTHPRDQERKKCGRRPMKPLHVAREAHPTAPEAGALRETGRSAPLSKIPKAIGLCYKSVRTRAGRPFPLVFAPHTNVSTGVDFRSCLRGSGVSPDMERNTPAGETPALHFRSLKGIIFCASHTLLAHQDGIFLSRPPFKAAGQVLPFWRI